MNSYRFLSFSKRVKGTNPVGVLVPGILGSSGLYAAAPTFPCIEQYRGSMQSHVGSGSLECYTFLLGRAMNLYLELSA